MLKYILKKCVGMKGEREREDTQAEGAAEREGEAGSQLSREPNTGPDPRILRSRPEPKADARPTEPPRSPSRL